MDTVFEPLFFAMFGVVIGGVPSYAMVGPSKPNRKEVLETIKKEVPLIMAEPLKEIAESNKKMEVAQGKMSVQLENLINQIKRIDK